jgi:hypothetical protein
MDTRYPYDTPPGDESKDAGRQSDPIYGDFPRDLLERRQLVNYKMGRRPRRHKPDQITKVPHNPRTGQKASVDDPDTWGTAAEAAEGVTRWHMKGAGFMFAEGEQERGTDLHACYDLATGRVTDEAMEIVRRLNSYTEISPSGVGLHIFVRARDYPIPLGQSVTHHYGHKVEMYDHGRFFTITGRHLPGTPFTVEERSVELCQVHETIWGAERGDASAARGPDGRYAPPTCGRTGLSDDDVMAWCRKDKEGERFQEVYDDGDLSHFEYDDSLGDWFVWRKLVFYIGDDPARIARLAEQGAHYLRPDDPAEAAARRKKWQRREAVYDTFQLWQIAILLAGRGPDTMYGGSSSQAKKPATEAAKAWPSPMADVAYYGVLGDIAKGIEPYIETDSAALLVNLLVASGIAMGRGPYVQVGAKRHYAVLNAVTVGETADNKSDAKTPIMEMTGQAYGASVDAGMDVAYGELAPPTLPGGLSTGEGLLWQIRDERHEKRRDKKTHAVEDVVVDEGVADKRLLVVEAEFARVLAVMYRDGNTLSTVLRDLFDSPPEAESSPKNNPVVATAPHVGLIGQV